MFGMSTFPILLQCQLVILLRLYTLWFKLLTSSAFGLVINDHYSISLPLNLASAPRPFSYLQHVTPFFRYNGFFVPCGARELLMLPIYAQNPKLLTPIFDTTDESSS